MCYMHAIATRTEYVNWHPEISNDSLTLWRFCVRVSVRFAPSHPQCREVGLLAQRAATLCRPTARVRALQSVKCVGYTVLRRGRTPSMVTSMQRGATENHQQLEVQHRSAKRWTRRRCRRWTCARCAYLYKVLCFSFALLRPFRMRKVSTALCSDVEHQHTPPPKLMAYMHSIFRARPSFGPAGERMFATLVGAIFHSEFVLQPSARRAVYTLVCERVCVCVDCV